MDDTASLELNRLLGALGTGDREAAWNRLIERHSRLILAAAASFRGGHDEVMDRYAYVLEKLRENDFRRLRAFRPDGTARFSTWLTLAARRLCVDRHRARYGRARPLRDGAEAITLRAIRRQLADPASATDVELLPDQGAAAVDDSLCAAGRDAALGGAIASLSARERLLLKLRFEDDLPASRIAPVLGLPTPFHVYRQLNATLLRLRAALHARGVDGVDG